MWENTRFYKGLEQNLHFGKLKSALFALNVAGFYDVIDFWGPSAGGRNFLMFQNTEQAF